MICHVCEKQAIGQCKSCGKFYCSSHGDVYCVKCAGAVKPSGGRLDRELDFRLPEYGGPERTGQPVKTYTGPTCHCCPSPATGACPDCGKFYCTAHGGNWTFWGPASLCDDCSSARAGRGLLGCLFGGVVLFISLMAVCSRRF
jgi:hypothetical protein